MANTSGRNLLVKFTGDNEVKLTGATAAVSNIIKEVAQSLGLEYRFDNNEKSWTITGGKVNEFVAQLHEKVKGKVKVVVEVGKQITTANKLPTTGDRLIKVAVALSLLQAEVVSMILIADKVSNSDLAKLIKKVTEALDEVRKMLE